MPDEKGRPTTLADLGEEQPLGDYPMHFHFDPESNVYTITGFLLAGRNIAELQRRMEEGIKQMHLDEPWPATKPPGGTVITSSTLWRLTVAITRTQVWSRQDEEKWRPG